MGLFGTGVAAADDYAGQTYADASSAASDAGAFGRRGRARSATSSRQDDCLVTRSQTRTVRRAPMTARTCPDQVQFYLNCNGGLRDGDQRQAPRWAARRAAQAKAAADEAAAEEQAKAEEEAPLEEVSTSPARSGQ